jgi:hypothetical protein
VSDVSLVERVSRRIARVSTDGEVALWSVRTLRKATACAVCRVEIPTGRPAFGPIGTPPYRTLRVHGVCLGLAEPADRVASAETPTESAEGAE